MILTMGRRLVILALSVLSVMLVARGGRGRLEGPVIRPRRFSLKGSDGQTYSLDQFKGEVGGCDRVVSQGVYRRMHQVNANRCVKTAKPSTT